MTKEEELEKVKVIIKDCIEVNHIRYGFFSTRNILGDKMTTIFKGDFITLDVCRSYGYFELFGCSDEEFEEMKKYYISLGGMD